MGNNKFKISKVTSNDRDDEIPRLFWLYFIAWIQCSTANTRRTWFSHCLWKFSNYKDDFFKWPIFYLKFGNSDTVNSQMDLIRPYALEFNRETNVPERYIRHVQQRRKRPNDIKSWIVAFFAELFEIFCWKNTFYIIKKSPWRMLIKSGNYNGFS